MNIKHNSKVENEFYYTNFLTLFNDDEKVDAVSSLADKAIESRNKNQRSFVKRSDELLTIFEKDKANIAFQPYLQGWDLQLIDRLRAEYGGVLISLFHYGPHRHVLMDLACMGVEITAPIAKKAYWKQYELRDRALGNSSHCMQLLEVEKNTVGRDLFLSIRAGRIGVIYVDGNMGPESYQAAESVLTVNFFNRRINVKAGIARLAQAFNYPILPVFTTDVGACNHRVQFSSLVLPHDKNTQSKTEWQQTTMQHLYSELEKRVAIDPSQWEFALYLHRWLVKDTKIENDNYAFDKSKQMLASLSSEGSVHINRKNVSVMHRGDKSYWIDVNAERGYSPPNFMPGLFTYLERKKGITVSQIQTLSGDSVSHQKILNILAQLHINQMISVTI